MNQIIKLWTRQLLLLFMGGLGFLACFGKDYRIVSPQYYQWMLGGDWAFMFMGWMSFFKESWTWPLGSIDGYLFPMNLTLATTDSIPWWSFLSKLLFSNRSGEFQTFGLWFLLCFILQAQFAWLLAREYLRTFWAQLAFVALCISSPILFYRIGHPALCAHWLILAALWRFLRPYGRWSLIWDALLVTLASMTHPYFVPMVLGPLGVKALYSFSTSSRKAGDIRTLLGRVALLVLVCVLSLYSIGLIGQYRLIKGPISIWTADALTFFQPFQLGRMTSQWGIPEFGSGEGFGYLGLGVIVTLMCLAGVTVGRRWKVRDTDSRWQMRTKWLAATALALFFWGLGEELRVAGQKIATFHTVYKPFYPVIGVFRCAGRLIWPAYYLIFLVAVFGLERHLRRSWLLALGLSTLLIVQITDVSPLFRWNGLGMGQVSVRTEAWDGVAKGARSLVMIPPQIQNTRCNDPHYSYEHWIPLALLAQKRNLSFNSGGSANPPDNPAERYCHDLAVKLEKHQWAEDELYVIEKNFLAKNSLQGLSCQEIDGFIACRAQSERRPF